MTGRTISERIFEDFCTRKALLFERIPEGENTTPDYLLKVAGIEIVVEVKEIQPNDEEREAYKRLDETGFSVTTSEPGARVRSLITRARKQIRAQTKGKHPGMLVLFDPSGSGNLMPEDIKTAMHGSYTVRRTVPRQYDPSRSGSGRLTHGRGRKMTESDNTSISAVAVLRVDIGTNSVTDIHFHVYHNVFAALPIDPRILAPYALGQQKYDLNHGGWNRCTK